MTFNPKKFSQFLRAQPSLLYKGGKISRMAGYSPPYYAAFYCGDEKRTVAPPDKMMDAIISVGGLSRDLVYAHAGKLPPERLKELVEDVISKHG